MRRPFAHRRTVGAAEAGLGIVLAALAVGAFVGNGLARTAVDIPDGLTWLADDRRGEVVQVNPETGKVDSRLRTGQPGDDLRVAQRNGMLVITNQRDGSTMVVDLSTLLVTGQRQAADAGEVKVLLAEGRIYLAELGRGELHFVDPFTAGTIGQPLVVGESLADVAVDGTDTVWLLPTSGELRAVRWSADAKRFVEQQRRPVTGAGSGAVLAAHERGVTVFGPEGGVVVRIGTERDLAAAVPRLKGQVAAADTSPATLAPASAADTGVVVLAKGDRVLEVAVGGLGCPRPGKPAVFRGEIYVTCLGARKVLVLTMEGQRAREDIVIPQGSGEAELVLDDGRLIITVAGADTGVLVDSTGVTRVIQLHDPGLPVRDPTVRPSATPSDQRPATRPSPPVGGVSTTPSPTRSVVMQPQTTPNEPGGTPAGAPQTVRPSRSPLPPTVAPPATGPPTVGPPAAPGGPTTRPPTNPAPGVGGPPTVVLGSADASGSVRLNWTPPAVRPDGYAIRCDSCGGGVLARVGGGATSAVVTTVPPGTTTHFIVRSEYNAGGGFDSAPSNAVTVFTRPGAPGGVFVSGPRDLGNALELDVSWSPAAANGSPVTSYEIELAASGGDRQVTTVSGGTTATSLQLGCWGGPCDGMVVTARVVATNAAGAGPEASTTYVYQAPPAPPGPAPSSPRTLPPTRPPISRGPTGRPIEPSTSPASLTGTAATAPLLAPVLIAGLAGAVLVVGRRRRDRGRDMP